MLLIFLLFASCLFADTIIQPPVLLSTAGIDATQISIVVDNQGNTVALWIENGAALSANYVNEIWSSAVILSNSGASDPSLVIDSNANVTALWLENSIIKKTASLPFGGNWSSATALSNLGASAPNLAIDAVGNIAAIWISTDIVQSAVKPVNGNWPLLPDTLMSSSASVPQVAIGGGTVVAVWQGLNGVVPTIYSASKAIAGNWNASVAISDGINFTAQPQVAVKANGKAMAMWFQYSVTESLYENVIVQSSYYNESQWGIPITVSKTAGKRDPRELSLDVGFDQIGNAIATWTMCYDGSTFYVHSCVHPHKENWLNPIDVAISFYSYFVDLSILPSGYASAIWLYCDNAIDLLQMQYSSTQLIGTSQNRWTPPYPLSLSLSNNGYPVIATSQNGSTSYGTGAWLHFDGTNNRIAVVTGKVTDLIQPPTQLTVTQEANSFGVFTEYYYKLSWMPSLSSDVTNYKIYRNNQFIGSVDVSSLEFLDHNRYQNETITYVITSVDTSYIESAPTIIVFP